MRAKRRVLSVAMSLAIALFMAFPGELSAQGPSPDSQASDGPSTSTKHPKLSSSIAKLVEAARRLPDSAPLSDAVFYAARPSMAGYMESGLLRMDAVGRLQVYVHLADGYEGGLSELRALGAAIEVEADGGVAQASVPLRAISQMAALAYVRAITPPDYGFVDAGSALTEGDALLDFDDLRSALGVDGSGVTVGVISDGIFGLESAVSSGDLPPTTLSRDGGGKLLSTGGGVIASSFRADGDLEAGLSPGTNGAEGTAMLEIVHDIAPGAQLRFANFSTTLEFMAAVDFLAQNSDVVIDDISFFGGPYDQTSSVSANTSAELNRLTSPIRAYFTSAGNSAARHYQETYVDSGFDANALLGFAGNLHLFSATGETTDCFSLGSSPANVVFLAPGQTANVFLTWDEPLGAVTSDYDLFALESGTATVVDSSISDNPSLGFPIELLTFSNSSGVAKFYDILVQNSENLSPPRNFDMYALGTGLLACDAGGSTAFNYNTLGSSIPIQGDAGGGVISVGAINASDPGADTIAPYSSRGPADNSALKPEVVAIDGVAVTGAGGFSNPFFGTSASAPHVAGLAALLLELRPDLLGGEPGDDPAADRIALRDAILSTAVDLGIAGDDNTYGSGRVNGLAAGQALADSAPEPEPTPEPIPSLSAWGILALAAVFGLLAVRRIRTRIL
ncbi:MAG: S8 family serine peptidase [Chloroflexi bacterium]|nr:S8 family serine peptidase [Chloroflexota bacterium]